MNKRTNTELVMYSCEKMVLIGFRELFTMFISFDILFDILFVSNYTADCATTVVYRQCAFIINHKNFRLMSYVHIYPQSLSELLL